MNPSIPMRALVLAMTSVVPAVTLAEAAASGPAPVQEGGVEDQRAARLEEVGRELRRTVLYLASYRRVGRRAGTPGALDAVLWLSAQLRNYNLMPAGEDEYLQPFDVPLPVRDGGDSWLQGVRRFEGERQVVPLASSAPGGCQGPVEYHGLGIEQVSPPWNDYPHDVEPGTIVLLVDGAPAAQPAGAFSRATTPFQKIVTAAERGAGAVLLAPHPDDSSGDLEPFRQALEAPIPALRISRDAAQALCPGYLEESRTSLKADLAHGTGEVSVSEAEVGLMANIEGGQGTGYNVLARIEGRGGPTVVIGAHLDHLGRGGLGSLSDDHAGEVHLGADDNASGVAVVWHMVDQLLGSQEPAGDVVFAFWSGQAQGALGSRHWIEQPTVPLAEVAAYLNVDAVGRASSQGLTVLGAGSSPAFTGWMDAVGAGAGLVLAPESSFAGVGGSDLQPFLRQGIPGLHLTSGIHAASHSPADDVPLFEAAGAARVAAVALDLVARLQAEPDLPFRALERPDADREATVDLGVVVLDGVDREGVAIRETLANGSAERAGLLPGDVLLQVGDVDVADELSVDQVEQFHTPGDVVLVRFLRGGIERQLRLTLRP